MNQITVTTTPELIAAASEPSVTILMAPGVYVLDETLELAPDSRISGGTRE